MKNCEKHRLKNNWTKAQSLFNRYNLEGWKLKCVPMIDKVGLCSYNERTIYLSSYFLQGANCNYAKTKKALMHEIAHALTPGHSHDDVWKRMCQKLGGDDRLAATMNEPNMNWSLYCKSCKTRFETKTYPGSNLMCGKCRTTIRIKQIF